jgi:hypothetical protein
MTTRLSTLIVGSLSLAFGAPQARVETTVGMPARIEQHVLPGGELEVVPSEGDAPLTLRIVASYPHGDSFRYDLEFWALEPGEYDLGTLLRRKDGTAAELPPIPVAVTSVLPAGQRPPHEPDSAAIEGLGGYRTLLAAGVIAWFAGLFAILWRTRRRRIEIAATARPKTLAERLEPLVQRARAGELSTAERAQLELGLVAYWRRKLALETLTPQQAMASLRGHAEAGPLLVSLERWLHDPQTSGEVDVSKLLEPYRRLAEDAIALPGVAREPVAANGGRR